MCLEGQRSSISPALPERVGSGSLCHTYCHTRSPEKRRVVVQTAVMMWLLWILLAASVVVPIVACFATTVYLQSLQRTNSSLTGTVIAAVMALCTSPTEVARLSWSLLLVLLRLSLARWIATLLPTSAKPTSTSESSSGCAKNPQSPKTTLDTSAPSTLNTQKPVQRKLFEDYSDL